MSGTMCVVFSGWVMSNSLQSRGLQHARLPCCLLSLGVCSNSWPLSQWYYLTISFSAAPFSFCLQSFPASGSFQRDYQLVNGAIGSELRFRYLKYGIYCPGIKIIWFSIKPTTVGIESQLSTETCFRRRTKGIFEFLGSKGKNLSMQHWWFFFFFWLASLCAGKAGKRKIMNLVLERWFWVAYGGQPDVNGQCRSVYSVLKCWKEMRSKMEWLGVWIWLKIIKGNEITPILGRWDRMGIGSAGTCT